jgi:hypothetical protein
VSVGILTTVALTYKARAAFRDDVEARVAAYFDATGMQRRGGARMLLKTATIFLWLAASYLTLVFLAAIWWQTVLLTTSLALAMAGVLLRSWSPQRGPVPICALIYSVRNKRRVPQPYPAAALFPAGRLAAWQALLALGAVVVVMGYLYSDRRIATSDVGPLRR